MQARFERSFITINSYHIRQSLAKCNGVELNVDFIRFFVYLNRAFDIRYAKSLKGPNNSQFIAYKYELEKKH